jgi:hypothetical protein
MKSPKESSEENDKLLFPIFTAVHQTPEFAKRILDQSYGGAHDTEVWLLIFEFVFGEPPLHDESLPHHYARGVTDPRWNVLLHTKEAYPSYQKFCLLQGTGR